jgi:hypothetical protein
VTIHIEDGVIAFDIGKHDFNLEFDRLRRRDPMVAYLCTAGKQAGKSEEEIIKMICIVLLKVKEDNAKQLIRMHEQKTRFILCEGCQKELKE